MRNLWLKINLYILSLGLLFVFFIVITVFKISLASKIVTYSSVILLIYSVFSFFIFDYEMKGSTEIPFEITEIESIDYEHLLFLATYVVPLISFNFSHTRQVIVLGLLLVAMGCIYVKTDLFYANPSLALLGYRIYRANGAFKNNEIRENITLICRGKLAKGQKAHYIKLDDKIYYIRRI